MRLNYFLAAAALLTASLAAHADVITQTFNNQGTGTFENLVNAPVSPFNPALGTLTSVTLSTSGTYTNSTAQYFFVNVNTSIFEQPFAHTVNQPQGPLDPNGSFAFLDTTTDPAALLQAQEGINAGVSAEFDGPFLASANVTEVLTYNYNPAATPVAATPEPSSFALLGTGLLGALGVTRKRFA